MEYNFEKFNLDALEDACQVCEECGIIPACEQIRHAIDAYFESDEYKRVHKA